MTTAPAITQPARHVLALPPEDCSCGMCTASWARRRGKSRQYTELVTLADALDREEPAARPGMIAQHVACLAAMTTAATLAAADTDGELGAPQIGLPLLMFAGELAVAVQPGEYRDQIPAALVAISEQAITTAAAMAATCLAGMVDAIQALSTLAS
jgi:hypothetical protein